MVELHPTLVRPPPVDPAKSLIENALELTDLSQIGPDIFTNTRPLWRPPGARGIFGGTVIAMCLSAAQRTVPSTFSIHSMHCYFVLAGDSDIPVMYYVEHVREGRSYATRTVQARQRGACIFTTTMSFMRENSGGSKTVNHAIRMPMEVTGPEPEDEKKIMEEDKSAPFMSQKLQILEGPSGPSGHAHEKRARQWVKARGRISPEGGYQAHVAALAYISDSYLIGTVSRLNGLNRFKQREEAALVPLTPEVEAYNKSYLRHLKEKEGYTDEELAKPDKPILGMMVSLDHTIYFHEPRRFRADEWMLADRASHWSGDGRGVATQYLWSHDGLLLATCMQEGVVRLQQEPKLSSAAVLVEPKL